jgi:hypothetical protein
VTSNQLNQIEACSLQTISPPLLHKNRGQRIGLQYSLIYVNTPIRARKKVFKTTLLDKIVRYTNKYGLLHAKRCVDMTGIWFIACQMTAITLSLAKYNKYMGGVDLANMRPLHCNLTIMGQNRWWLKLFSVL